MAERDWIDQLDRALDRLLAGGAPEARDTPAGEMVRLAAILCDSPREDFRIRLRNELLNAKKENKMTATATHIPAGFRTVTPYLHPPRAAEFIDFVKKAFDAEEKLRVPTPDGRIMHAELKIGDSVLELGEATPMPAALHMYLPDADTVYQRAIDAGAVSLHPLTDQPYGDREGSVRDPFGNNWYIATHKQGASFVPEGLHTITPYLHTVGAPALLEFLEKAFGADTRERYEADGRIVHAKVRLGDSVIELSEAHGQWGPMPQALHLYVEDADAVYRRALDAGATPDYAPADTPYGDRGSGVTDAFGNKWYIHTRMRL